MLVAREIRYQSLAYWFVLCFLSWGIVACNTSEKKTESDTHSLSPQQLIDEGYYAYLFPEDFAIQSGWTVNLRMHSFNYHCSKSSDVVWNPVTVVYSNSFDEDIDIRISPPNTNPFFDDNATIEEIPLTVEWIPSQIGQYYIRQSGGTTMRFTDRFGMDIVIISSLQHDELVLLISELEYFGPDIDSVGNPWVDACQ